MKIKTLIALCVASVVWRGVLKVARASGSGRERWRAGNSRERRSTGPAGSAGLRWSSWSCWPRWSDWTPRTSRAAGPAGPPGQPDPGVQGLLDPPGLRDPLDPPVPLVKRRSRIINRNTRGPASGWMNPRCERNPGQILDRVFF